ncbi:undecaprenyl pyrophosphate phosphatase [Yersinia pekkanenii]|uniref:Undecaprenyl pyrophosphate phosphatase n=1 Tax=Yersinia pekkanenii TaxID=1288385 RepID=A0A0T9Q328_9GAMM|nr:undecaprenyl pyrophosphate phosphatase [Yersinia pekkanenii]CRY68530.1 undecaprenyl pyrophosphate phosphatase [Yersinia pekkanenii]
MACGLSELTGIPTKDASGDSFPGDHGMMLMILACFMLRYFSRGAFAISPADRGYFLAATSDDWRALVY